MNIKINVNNLILKNKIMIELNRNLFFYLINSMKIFSRERDQYEHRVVELDRQITQHELHTQTQTKEKENLLHQLAEARQEIVLLRQDKEYLTRQYNDIQQKFYSAEEKISTLEATVDETKRAKEILYEKHISSRDAYKTEYENKLAIELEQLRSKTTIEVDKLRDSVKEMYERENR
jgi:progesterone-induced-blocking factor 1